MRRIVSSDFWNIVYKYLGEYCRIKEKIYFVYVDVFEKNEEKCETVFFVTIELQKTRHWRLI